MIWERVGNEKKAFPKYGNRKGMKKSIIRERESEAFILGNGREREFPLTPDILACPSFFVYKIQILVKAVFFATAIYLHRLRFSPVKLGSGQQRKKPEATAGLVSEMVLGATTWLVSSQRDLCRGHVFFRFGGTLAF